MKTTSNVVKNFQWKFEGRGILKCASEYNFDTSDATHYYDMIHYYKNNDQIKKIKIRYYNYLLYNYLQAPTQHSNLEAIKKHYFNIF